LFDFIASSSRNGNSGSNSTTAASLIKLEQQDDVTVTVDESANASEMDHGDHTEDDLEDSEQLLPDADDCHE